MQNKFYIKKLKVNSRNKKYIFGFNRPILSSFFTISHNKCDVLFLFSNKARFCIMISIIPRSNYNRDILNKSYDLIFLTLLKF